VSIRDPVRGVEWFAAGVVFGLQPFAIALMSKIVESLTL